MNNPTVNKTRFRYPMRWRIMDSLETGTSLLWPKSMSRYTGWLLLSPALLLVGILVIGLVQIADSSMRTLDTSTYLFSETYSGENYATIIESATYAKVIWRSLLGAFLTVVFTLLLAFPYSYILVRTRSALTRKTLLVILFLPFFIGQVVRAYGWLIILGNSGAVNEVLGLVGIAPMRLLFNFPAVIFGLVQYMLPFAVLLLAPALTAIPQEIETAAGSLGANWRQTLWHVILPMAKPGLIGAGLVVATLSLTDFAMPAMLGGGSQDFIANAIYDQFFRTSNQGLGAALALVLVGIGSIMVGIVFMIFGAGTLGMGAKK
ncbi:ABC transporter permease [Cohaesibacter celericrescens]|uniref:ABC transporter permease n=1 Tax=Cohaesibacter celericrescens TaxID=2067669 RepID=A0A2N5XRY9_9HYPH|nr:ABC transporter permease [Cohaesibacter celericrescens]PLW77220.1 ABC transporter permease [Cohaesibacter celericrescens]